MAYPILFAVVLVFMTGCAGERGDSGSSATSPPVLQLGESVFARNCASCHGSKGGGGIGPKLGGGAVVERYPNPSDHREVVAEGRGAMPAFGGRLSEEEIDAVVRYERERL